MRNYTGEQRMAIKDRKNVDFLEGTFNLLSGLHLYGGKAVKPKSSIAPLFQSGPIIKQRI